MLGNETLRMRVIGLIALSAVSLVSAVPGPSAILDISVSFAGLFDQVPLIASIIKDADSWFDDYAAANPDQTVTEWVTHGLAYITGDRDDAPPSDPQFLASMSPDQRPLPGRLNLRVKFFTTPRRSGLIPQARRRSIFAVAEAMNAVDSLFLLTFSMLTAHPTLANTLCQHLVSAAGGHPVPSLAELAGALGGLSEETIQSYQHSLATAAEKLSQIHEEDRNLLVDSAVSSMTRLAAGPNTNI